MEYELRMYTPHKGMADEYAEVFHKYPEQVYQRGAKILAMWKTEEEQPAFVYLVEFRDKAHREEFRKTLGPAPEMEPYRPLRAKLIDSSIPAKTWLLQPVKHSKLQ